VRKGQEGFVAISSALVILAVVLTLTVSVSLLSIGEMQASLALSKGEENLHFVEGCVEEALLKSRNNANYAGGSLTQPEGNCEVAVSKAENVWTVTVKSLGTQHVRPVRVVFERTVSGLSILSWREI
jgi:hypothetical protein